MFKSTLAFFNAINEKKATKKCLELYDLSGNNPVKLDSSTNTVEKLNLLTDEYRRNNIKVYSKNMAELIGKRAVFAAPIMLGGLIISSLVNGKYIKTVTADTAYKTTVIEFDEESLLSEDGELYAHACFNNDFVYDNIQNCGCDANIDNYSYATLYYGEGSNSLQVKFDINEDNTWNYSSHTNNLYEKKSNSSSKPIGELDEKYKQLIKEATETFIKQADLTEEEVALLREMISNNENDILVKINRCVDLSGFELEVYKYHWFRSLLLIIAEIVVIGYIIEHFEDLSEVNELEARNCCIVKHWNYINIIKASKNHYEEFLLAEKNRILSIIDVLKNNGGSEEAISKYEKRLSLNKKESLKLTDDL